MREGKKGSWVGETLLMDDRFYLFQIKVLELMEALESSGSYSQQEIQEKTAGFREKLLKVGGAEVTPRRSGRGLAHMHRIKMLYNNICGN